MSKETKTLPHLITIRQQFQNRIGDGQDVSENLKKALEHLDDQIAKAIMSINVETE